MTEQAAIIRQDLSKKQPVKTNLNSHLCGILPITQQIASELFPDFKKTDRGVKLKATRENLQMMFDRYGISAKYDVLKKDQVIDIPAQSYGVSNRTNAVLGELDSLVARNDLPVSTVKNGLIQIMDGNSVNPVLDWVKSAEWDQVDRISDLIGSIHVPSHQERLKKAYIKSWLVQSVGALYNEGDYKIENVLVFAGDQGKGKTTWFNNLLPRELSDYKADGVTLKPDDKDSVMSCVSHWLVELGELDTTFSKSEVGHLKAFLSKTRDKFRRPYDRADSHFARQTSFFATVNDRNFLIDTTGNRRYMVLDVESIDRIESFNMQQIWAQAHHELLLGDGAMPWELSDELKSLQNASNEMFSSVDPVAEVIESKMDPENENARHFTGSATVIARMLGLKFENKSTVSAVGNQLRKMGYKQGKRTSTGRLWIIPRIGGAPDWIMFDNGFGAVDLTKDQIRQIVSDGKHQSLTC